MKTIKYTRHEVHAPSEGREASLLSFVYDVPYLSCHGILPPLHLLNVHLQSGGSDGGMGPGAEWEPFI